MPVSLTEAQAVEEMAQILYPFLPGTPHPAADDYRSFPSAARHVGLGEFWTGGSKRPAICRLLEQTLAARRRDFCPLILEIVRRGMQYRTAKGDPVTREEIARLNHLLRRVEFKIPELWDAQFLGSLPSDRPEPEPTSKAPEAVPLEELRRAFGEVISLAPQARGYAFERFLTGLFDAAKLAPRGSFRLVGEQIDGSFQLDETTYLVEAKWQNPLTDAAELLTFQGKVERKATWARGLFISYTGFTEDGLTAFGRGHSTNIIAMIGQDLHFILEGRMPLVEALRLKSRRAAETGAALVTVYELILAAGQ